MEDKLSTVFTAVAIVKGIPSSAASQAATSAEAAAASAQDAAASAASVTPSNSDDVDYILGN